MGLIINGRVQFDGKFNGVFPQLPPPTPSFTASPTTGLVPLTVNFTNTTAPGTGVSYEWDFTGDGSVDSTDVNPTYTYTTTGTFSVSLTTVNTGGRITTTASNYIIPYDMPPNSATGTAVNIVPVVLAVYDVNTAIGSTNIVPFEVTSDPAISQTAIATAINDVPVNMINYYN